MTEVRFPIALKGHGVCRLQQLTQEDEKPQRTTTNNLEILGDTLINK